MIAISWPGEVEIQRAEQPAERQRLLAHRIRHQTHGPGRGQVLRRVSEQPRRSNSSAVSELPEGTALSTKSLRRAINCSWSALTWKKPPPSASRKRP